MLGRAAHDGTDRRTDDDGYCCCDRHITRFSDSSGTHTQAEAQTNKRAHARTHARTNTRTCAQTELGKLYPRTRPPSGSLPRVSNDTTTYRPTGQLLLIDSGDYTHRRPNDTPCREHRSIWGLVRARGTGYERHLSVDMQVRAINRHG